MFKLNDTMPQHPLTVPCRCHSSSALLAQHLLVWPRGNQAVKATDKGGAGSFLTSRPLAKYRAGN